jgi:hypothetical protein
MRHTGAPERNSKLQFCYHSRPQIFLLIPHARSAHHARSASNKMNDPETSSTRPRKTENWKETIAVESKTTATRPRTIRPLVSMLRVKYLFMMFERSFETTPVFFFFGTQRSFPDLAARTNDLPKGRPERRTRRSLGKGFHYGSAQIRVRDAIVADTDT